MNNKYKEYCPRRFRYDYPYTWEERNKKYLEKRDDRPVKVRTISEIFDDEDLDNGDRNI